MYKRQFVKVLALHSLPIDSCAKNNLEILGLNYPSDVFPNLKNSLQVTASKGVDTLCWAPFTVTSQVG